MLETSQPSPDVEFLAEHESLLYVSHNSLGTLLVVAPNGTVVDEIRFVPPGAANPNPQGIAFDSAERAYVALEASGELAVLDVSQVPACALGAHARPCTTEVARLDLKPLASPGANPMPSRVAVAGGRAFVTLWNLDDFFNVPAGSSGRVAAIDTATATFDAAFAGTANGLVDLGDGLPQPGGRRGPRRQAVRDVRRVRLLELPGRHHPGQRHRAGRPLRVDRAGAAHHRRGFRRSTR